eukprot:17617-Chlamydomonas_euryale.AAC.2
MGSGQSVAKGMGKEKQCRVTPVLGFGFRACVDGFAFLSSSPTRAPLPLKNVHCIERLWCDLRSAPTVARRTQQAPAVAH